MKWWCRRLASISISAVGVYGFAATLLGDSMHVRRLLDAGAYAQAEARARDWISEVEAREGLESLALARAWDVLVEALDRNGRAAAPETLQLAERVVLLKEHHLGANHPETALSVQNLGVARAHRGEFTNAATLHERALTVRLASSGADEGVVADSLDHFAFALIQLQRFEEAERRLNESKRIRESRQAESPLELAGTLGLLGLLHRSSGRFADAVAPLERALGLQRKLSPRHPETATLLQIRGDVYFLLGEIRQAQDTWSAALHLFEEALRPDHPAFAELLRRMALAAFSIGNLAETRRLGERALQIGELSLAPCDPAVTALSSGLAMSRRADGEYAQARQLYRRALRTIEQCTGVNASNAASDAYATALYNEAGLARETGDFSEAERLYRRAVEVWTRGLGANHPFVARGLNDLAEVAAARGQFTRARTLYERVLASRRRSLGAAHPDVAVTLTNLARTMAESGHPVLALRHLTEAAAIYDKAGVADEPDQFADFLALRGRLEARQGNYAAARRSVTAALAERERIFGSTHPASAETRATLAGLDYALGVFEQALESALSAEQAGRDHFQFTIRYLPERQAMAYSMKRPRALDLALSIAVEIPQHAAKVVDAVIRSRGVVLDELAARARSASSVDLTSHTTALATARQRFANLVVRSLEENVPRALVDQARTAKEEAERALAEKSAAFRQELERRDVGLTHLRNALPSGSALVSIVRYDQSITSHTRTIPHYAAFVVLPGRAEPVVVPLGIASAIDRAVSRWRTEAGLGPLQATSPAAPEVAYRVAGQRLRTLVWDPLAPYLADAGRVFIVPDGTINLVNFGALPVGVSEFLIERGPTIHYLATERDLIVPADQTVARTGLLALGGPAFDGDAPMTRGVTGMRRSASPECPTLQSLLFEALPATLGEATEVASMWKLSGSGEAHLSTAGHATERAFKQLAPGRRVLHLATHGFFLGGDCASPAPGTRAVGRITTARTRPAPAIGAQNPLLMSGLAFAGANLRAKAKPDEEDGILTAEEIAGMNLQGTEWAVLSACDTGLGEVKAGEGVFGLRRAFQIAGVRTVIMSLWSVEDQATREWMRTLYRARLNEGLDTAESVRAASLHVLRDRRARRLSTHPFHWGAFVSAGDWR